MSYSPLTNDTYFLVNHFFDVCDRGEVIHILETRCGNNLTFLEKLTPKELERFRFAVIKCSEGSMEKFLYCVDLANTDWRDLLMGAGFGNSLSEHRNWFESIALKAKI